MLQESKLLKTIISRQAVSKSEMTYNFIHKTQNMLSILHFIIDDLVEGKKPELAGEEAKRLLEKYGDFLSKMKSFCHLNGRHCKSCSLKEAIDFSLSFKKVHLREQKVNIVNNVDSDILVEVSPFDLIMGLNELIPLLADSLSTKDLIFGHTSSVLEIVCDVKQVDWNSLQAKLAKAAFEGAKMAFEVKSSAIQISLAPIS